LGGAQSLHTNAMDEALSLPTEHAAKLALRTQQVIAHETGVADVVDPLGGSHLVEALTDELCGAAKSLIGEIDRRGGMVAAIELGYPQRAIQEAAYAAQQALERKEALVVGVNTNVDADEQKLPRLRVDPKLEAAQQKRLADVRGSRDASRVETALAKLEQAARSTDNLVPFILEAVRAMGTVGEIADTMRRVFGEHREIST
jgi:methylmalonyl-CoA mutase N-terminal domain/subunit